MLLVFHFIIRDGFTPKFWRKVTVKRDLIEQAVMTTDYNFYNRINFTVAKRAFNFKQNLGLNFHQAIQMAEKSAL